MEAVPERWDRRPQNDTAARAQIRNMLDSVDAWSDQDYLTGRVFKHLSFQDPQGRIYTLWRANDRFVVESDASFAENGAGRAQLLFPEWAMERQAIPTLVQTVVEFGLDSWLAQL